MVKNVFTLSHERVFLILHFARDLGLLFCPPSSLALLDSKTHLLDPKDAPDGLGSLRAESFLPPAGEANLCSLHVWLENFSFEGFR
jgi:hypothetical protein